MTGLETKVETKAANPQKTGAFRAVYRSLNRRCSGGGGILIAIIAPFILPFAVLAGALAAAWRAASAWLSRWRSRSTEGVPGGAIAGRRRVGSPFPPKTGQKISSVLPPRGRF